MILTFCFSLFFKFPASRNHKTSFWILIFDYRCSSLAFISTLILSNMLQIQVCHFSFINWVNNIPSQRKLQNYFQFNYISGQNNFRALLKAKIELWCHLFLPQNLSEIDPQTPIYSTFHLINIYQLPTVCQALL